MVNATITLNGVDVSEYISDSVIKFKKYKNKCIYITLHLQQMEGSLYSTYKDHHFLTIKIQDVNDVYIFIGRVLDIITKNNVIELYCESMLGKLKERKFQWDGLVDFGYVDAISEEADVFILEEFNQADETLPTGWEFYNNGSSGYGYVESDIHALKLFNTDATSYVGSWAIYKEPELYSPFYENPLLEDGGYIEFKVKTTKITAKGQMKIRLLNLCDITFPRQTDNTTDIYISNYSMDQIQLKDSMTSDTYYTIKIYNDVGVIKISIDATYKGIVVGATSNQFKIIMSIKSDDAGNDQDLIIDDFKRNYIIPPTNKVDLVDVDGNAFTWTTDELLLNKYGLLLENTVNKSEKTRTVTAASTLTCTNCTNIGGNWESFGSVDNDMYIFRDQKTTIGLDGYFTLDLKGDSITTSSYIKDIILSYSITTAFPDDFLSLGVCNAWVDVYVLKNETDWIYLFKTIPYSTLIKNEFKFSNYKDLKLDMEEFLIDNGAGNYTDMNFKFVFNCVSSNSLYKCEIGIDYFKATIVYDTKDYDPIYTSITSNTASSVVPVLNVFDYGVVAGDKFKLSKNLKQLIDDIFSDCDIPVQYNISNLEEYFVSESFNDYHIDILNRILKVNNLYLFEQYDLNGNYYVRLCKEDEGEFITSIPSVWDFEDDVNPFTNVSAGAGMEILDLSDGEYEKVLHVNEESIVYHNISEYNKEGTDIKCNFKIITAGKHFNIFLFLDDAGGFNVLDIKYDGSSYYRPYFGYISNPIGIWHSLEIKRGRRPSDNGLIWQVFWNGELVYTSVRNGGAYQLRFGWWSEYDGGGGGANTGAEFYLDNYSIETSFQEELSTMKFSSDWVNERKGNQYKGVRVTGNIRSNPNAFYLAIDDTVGNVSPFIKELSFPQLLTKTECREYAIKLLEFYKVIRPNYKLNFLESMFISNYQFDYGHKIKFSMTYPTITDAEELITNIGYTIEYPVGQYLIELEAGTGETTPNEELGNRVANIEESIRMLESAYSGRTEYQVRQIIRDEDQADLNADLNNYLLIANIDNTPVNAEIEAPISSDWAYKIENEAYTKAGILTLTSSPIVKLASGNIAMQKADGTEIFKISHNDTNTTLLSTAGSMTLTAKAGSAVVVESVSHDGGAVSGITTLSMNNQLTNTLADGTKPLVITSTTKCDNLNADKLDGADLETTWTDSDTKICSSKAMKTKVDALISAAGAAGLMIYIPPIYIKSQAGGAYDYLWYGNIYCAFADTGEYFDARFIIPYTDSYKFVCAYFSNTDSRTATVALSVGSMAPKTDAEGGTATTSINEINAESFNCACTNKDKMYIKKSSAFSCNAGDIVIVRMNKTNNDGTGQWFIHAMYLEVQ